MPITKPARENRQFIIETLNNEVIEITPSDHADFWQAATGEGMLSVLWHRLDKTKLPEERGQAVPDLRMQTAQFMRSRQVTGEALAAAHRRHIPAICLRGQALAEGLYENPAQRPQSDVDILVATADMPAFAEALQAARFEAVPLCPTLFRYGRILLDVHTDPIGIARIAARAHMTSLRAEGFFLHAVPGTLCGQDALVLEHRVLLPYLCLHALKHSFDRLIWLWDIALLAHRIECEQTWDAVCDGIREYQLERPCYFALSYVRRHMSAPVPEAILQAMRPSMGRRERSLFARFMAHEVIPYMAERLFARMIPDANNRLAFWWETILPDREVRQQFSGSADCAGCNFIRDRIRRLFGLCALLWREVGGLFRVP